MHSNQLLGPSILLRAWTRPERKVCAASVVLLSLDQVSMLVSCRAVLQNKNLLYDRRSSFIV